jgi:outer membrane receptor protein involved in Fe transport
MDRRNIGRVIRRALVAGILALVCLANVVVAGTSGKLSGRITDKKKQPLAGVNIAVVGLRLGAATDADGRFLVLNIPAGKIAVRVNLIGYRAVTTENVEINADNTTRLDVELEESVLEMKEVVVSARRPVVEVNRTSNIATVSRQQLQALPVQELQDVVNLQAGVVDGHFRGGREGEVQYQVDGVSVNNAYDNKSTVKLDRSLLEEVQVISGTFDAEYGQAMSGVVNAVLKRGSDKFHWDAEVLTGGPVYRNGSSVKQLVPIGDPSAPSVYDHPATRRVVINKFRPASQQNFQLAFQGPSYLPKTTYLVSMRQYYDENWVHGENDFSPGDQNEFYPFFIPHPSGDGKATRLGYSRDVSGVLKLSNRTLANTELSWQGLFNVTDARGVKWSYALNPYGTSKQKTFSFMQGVDVTHTLSPSRFVSLNLRQNFHHYRDYAFEDVFDPRYDAYGVPTTPVGLIPAWYVQGIDPTRFEQRTNSAVIKTAYVDQQTKERQLKVGAELQLPKLEFGSPGYLSYFADSNNVVRLQRITEYSAKYPGVQVRWPVLGAAFAQEEVEWNDLTLRGGVRFEYFDARSTIPSDFGNPANSISDVPLSHDVRTTKKYSLAPRLGVSYPISKDASLFFAYGHFYQLPGLGRIFENSDYNRLSDLQAGDASVPVMGNPDIKPERTVQYQFGFKQAITEDLGLDVTAFYKDIRDLLGTQILETYNGARYARMSNVDFGNVVGFTLSLTQRAKGLLSSKLDYTWQSAQGNSSSPSETADLAASGQDPRPRSVPFDWDERHTLNLTLALSRADIFNISSIIRMSTGQPYTPAISTGFLGSLETNSGRKPSTLVVDLRGDRKLTIGGLGTKGFARVFNLFDTRFDNGFVFASTGDPYYTSNPGSDRGTLLDPTRYYGPRRIEIGLTLNVAN